MNCSVAKFEIPRILAHRGAIDFFPENGLAGFRFAIENGLHGFETDFRLAADGTLMVMHDSEIDRTTTGSGCLEKMTLAELKAVRLKGSDERIPTADELLALFEPLDDFYLELELKPRYGELYSPARMDEFLDKLYERAQRHLKDGCYVFTCFETDILRRMKERHPQAGTCLITEGLAEKDIISALKSRCYWISPTLVGTSQELVDRAKAGGLKVNLWHSDTLELWQKARDMGADYSTSNHPVQVLQAIRNAAR